MINNTSTQIKKPDLEQFQRRRFLQMLACSSVSALSFPGIATAAIHSDHQPRHLSFDHTHTGEKLSVTYYENGKYLMDALQEINILLRDHRTGDIQIIDPALLNQLHILRSKLGVSKPFHVISGYRSPFTNAQLQKGSNGVAKKSLHMQGKAIDVRIEGVDSQRLRNTAIAMHQGGVGYYQRSNFVHLDTGRVRTW